MVSILVARILRVCCLSALVMLTGCQLLPAEPKMTSSGQTADPTASLDYYSYDLARQLFHGLNPPDNMRFAVIGFVPVDSLDNEEPRQSPLYHLGHQLAESLLSEAAQRGFVVTDYKVANSILMSASTDRVLTRDVEQLSPVQDIDFYITGTITEGEDGAVVNARIINARHKDVVAAATSFFPANLFWTPTRVTSRGGMLLRMEK